MFDFLYADEPDMTPTRTKQPQAEAEAEAEPKGAAEEHKDMLPLPLMPISYPAMSQAFNVTEITTLIRQELRGFELKSIVLVNRLWWRTFGPYLWENVYVDADPGQDDRHIILRNGLAARRLALSVYDPLDSRGVVSYVAEKCRNVSALHLKLFSPHLVVINKEQQTENNAEDFATRKESETTLLDDLLAKLSHITDLTLSIAHEDLQPEVVWCASMLPGLKRMTIYGGLCAMKYMLPKNSRCNWTLLMRVCRACPYLESLSVAWRVPELHKSSLSDPHDLSLNAAVPPSEQVKSLRSLRVNFCELQDSTMDIVYRSCPNLREIDFDSIKISSGALDQHIRMMAGLCPLLRSFKLQNLPYNFRGYISHYQSGPRGDSYVRSLLCGPLLKVPSLKLSLGYQPRCSFEDLDRFWFIGNSITVLSVDDIQSYELLLKIITTMTGLSRLTLGGYLRGEGNPWVISSDVAGHSVVEAYYSDDMRSSRRLPGFASMDSLQFLDVTRLEFNSGKCYELFFNRVQNLPYLKHLEIRYSHLRGARLEEPYTDYDPSPQVQAAASVEPDGQPSDLNASSAVATDGAVDLFPDRIFRHFPAVEFLYVFDGNDWAYQRHITGRTASVLVQTMPKLKVMAFDQTLSPGGELWRIRKKYPQVTFDCIRV
ncbi:hypothetical protein BC939DRAFT_530235 [Gamsiella multidivaricata]|uniref:uncharacterized protein n=1 Tax=Gamsiella multidivaricata TaxID=101098 RepID=UPI00221E398F|nr:uncharacterized protein BC939DRAFT_530235 [Gamsiella multidivaricata]KAG0359181.1 hypothetical protein BGZ54_010074 [Gamsiella multidivaricata]KAI7821080.1 hypothetical protein BC939DRAFT_530235 [Gamsiella multidivaricata]